MNFPNDLPMFDPALRPYLSSSDLIDSDHPEVIARAKDLATGHGNELDVARRCFEFVRDEIRHSWDFKQNPVTCKASDVLLHGTGYCFAKSHLLAALLRANAIPAGMCYQRLRIEPGGPRFSLHGLNAIHLDGFGWYRVDARGNKPGVDAQFRPPTECLAFSAAEEGEADLPEIWPAPMPLVIETLRRCTTYDEVYANLPDVDLLRTAQRQPGLPNS
jgi:transglutaminase-like putative cysteine protease